MKTVILAGGFGTRLKDVVKDVPKPMALISGKPFLEHQIRTLKEQNLEDIILCVHYMANKIKSYFGDGGKFGIDITYSEEDMPLGTAGAIKNAEKYVDGPFFVLNGDTFSKIDLNDFLHFHNSKKGIATMGLTTSNESTNYGTVNLEGDRIINFAEKVGKNSGQINAGIYVFEPEIFEYIPNGTSVSLEKEIFPRLAKERNLFGYAYEGYFVDIGRPETYKQFKRDALDNFIVDPNVSVRDALKRMRDGGTEVLFITDEERNLLGVINDNILREYLINGGRLNVGLSEAMVRDPSFTGKSDNNEDEIHNLILSSGTRHLPILENGRLVNIRFHVEEVKDEEYPIIRGKAPLRISFAGGGTDLPYFFEEYGGAVMSATINKHCHATIRKRADSKITINSNLYDEDILFDSRNLRYDENFDLVKAVVNIVKPDFGFDMYLHNDVPPGRGLGSSASLSVLVTKLLTQLQGIEHSDVAIADIAYNSERNELGIRGGKQDQYAAATGGFNYMEFSKDRTIINSLNIKDSIVNEFRSYLTLCYAGKTHFSGDLHKAQEKSFNEKKDVIEKLNRMREISVEIKDLLLTGNLQKIGDLLHESWRYKREINSDVSNPQIDELYELGLRNGAYGGKLLGAGGGGYLLFYHAPEKRNQIVKALENSNMSIMDFDFELKGVDSWMSKHQY